MNRQIVSARLDGELLRWLDGYAAELECSRTAVLETGLRLLRERVGADPEFQDELGAAREARVSRAKGML